MSPLLRTSSLIPLLLALSACSSVDKYNPFSEEKAPEAYKPANATEYLCEGNKRFFVRTLAKENAVWLIYPDREVRLEAAGEGSSRYTNSVAVLEIGAEEASLSDGPNINYSACKAGRHDPINPIRNAIRRQNPTNSTVFYRPLSARNP